MHLLTCSCFLLLVLGRLFLLALPVLLGICPCSLWSPPFPLHALALILLSLAKMQLSPTLTLSSIMIWCCGQTALFLFVLAGAAPAYLPTALSVALRPLFPFRQAQYAQVFRLKPAPFCTLFAGLGSTNKSAIFLLFFSCLTLVLSLPPCPLLHLSCYLKLCGRSGRNCLLSSCSIRLQWVPEHLFLPGNNMSDELARRGVLLVLFAIIVVFLLLFHIRSCFAWTGDVLFHRSFLTHRFPRFPLRNLYSLIMLAVSSLVIVAMITAFF